MNICVLKFLSIISYIHNDNGAIGYDMHDELQNETTYTIKTNKANNMFPVAPFTNMV